MPYLITFMILVLHMTFNSSGKFMNFLIYVKCMLQLSFFFGRQNSVVIISCHLFIFPFWSIPFLCVFPFRKEKGFSCSYCLLWLDWGAKPSVMSRGYSEWHVHHFVVPPHIGIKMPSKFGDEENMHEVLASLQISDS